MPRALGPEHALLRGLREGGDEAELTRVLAALFQEEPELAASFVKLVLDVCPHRKRVDSAELPDQLVCVAEETVSEGRADLSFTDGSGGWHVIVENKLYSGYGRDQIGRYLRSFHDNAIHTVVAAVTRDVPSHGEPEGGTDHWAGSVRWARLLPALRELRPKNAELARQWPLFLDVLESEGSMGFTQPDQNLFNAWAQYISARQHMIDFLGHLREPLLGALREKLAAANRDAKHESLASFKTYGKGKRTITPRLGKVVIEFRVPADKDVRLWSGVWGWDEPRFFVELPFPKAGSEDKAKEAISLLKQCGFESWRDRLLTAYLPLTGELLSAPDLEERVVDFARGSFRQIVSSGILQLEAVEEPPTEEEDVEGA
ncbi:MAG: PD-(D/E)XK nuclease family protein [Gaiellaceae bacterium]